MATSVTITGSGNPGPSPDRAGPGVLVRHDGLNLQFDAGRATVMRLTALGVRPPELDALFVTHHHSDHLTGLADLVLTRWILDGRGAAGRRPGRPGGPVSGRGETRNGAAGAESPRRRPQKTLISSSRPR